MSKQRSMKDSAQILFNLLQKEKTAKEFIDGFATLQKHYSKETIRKILNTREADETKGYTLLCKAVAQGKEDVVELLLENGADVTKATLYLQRIPLHFLGIGKLPSVAKAVLEKCNATPSRLHSSINALDGLGRTPLYVAAYYGAAEVIQLLLARGARLDIANLKGRTPLHAASKYGYTDSVKHLISNVGIAHHKKQALLNRTCYQQHKTPLFLAAEHGRTKAIEILLIEGADPTIPNQYGITPLEIAHYQGYPGTVKILQEKLRASHPGKDNIRPWREILSEVARHKRAANEPYLFPYEIAYYGGEEAITALLDGDAGLRDFLPQGADWRTPDAKGRTLLHAAAKYNFPDKIRDMLKPLQTASEKDKHAFMLHKVHSSYSEKTAIYYAYEYGKTLDNGFSAAVSRMVEGYFGKKSMEELIKYARTPEGRQAIANFETAAMARFGWTPSHVASFRDIMIPDELRSNIPSQAGETRSPQGGEKDNTEEKVPSLSQRRMVGKTQETEPLLSANDDEKTAKAKQQAEKQKAKDEALLKWLDSAEHTLKTALRLWTAIAPATGNPLKRVFDSTSIWPTVITTSGSATSTLITALKDSKLTADEKKGLSLWGVSKKRLEKAWLLYGATLVSIGMAFAAARYSIALNNSLKSSTPDTPQIGNCTFNGTVWQPINPGTPAPTPTPTPAPTLETYQRAVEIFLYAAVVIGVVTHILFKSWNGKNGWLYQGRKKMGWVKEEEVVKEEEKASPVAKPEAQTGVPNQPETPATQKKEEEFITKYGIRNGIPIILKGIPRSQEQNGNDCGFIALGVQRKDIVKWLLMHAHDPRVRQMLASEIRSAVSNMVIPGAVARGEALPAEMRNDPELAIQSRYHATEDALNEAVARCKEKLGMPKEAEYSARQLANRLANPEPGDQEKGNTAFIQEHFSKIYQEATAAKQAYDEWLPEYCKRQRVFEDYTNYYYEPNGWLNYLPGGGDLPSQGTTIVDAIEAMAREQGKPVRIEIWRQKKVNETVSFTLQRQSLHQDGDLKRILFVDDNHFIEIREMMDIIKVDMAAAEAPAKPAPAPKSPPSHMERLQQQAEHKEKAVVSNLSH